MKELSKKDTTTPEKDLFPSFFCSCARICEMKTCCKKYKRGKRCKKCPKK